MPDYLQILKRVGKVLLIAGLLDTVIFILCIVTKTSYSSNLFVFAIIAGVFLMRGSLRAAGIVTWLSILCLFSALQEPILLLFQPFELLRLKFTLYSPSVLINSVLWAIPTMLYLWTLQELRQEPIIYEREKAKGKKIISPFSSYIA